MSEQIDISQLPTALEIVQQYIKLRDYKEKREKEFAKDSALSDEDAECLRDVRQLASLLEDTEANDIAALPWAEMPGLLTHLCDRLEELATPMSQYAEAMTTLAGCAQMILQATGQKALSTDAGTAYCSDTLSVKLEDREAFLTFVRAHNAWQFITNHISKEAVKEWLDMPGQDGKPANVLPPGISTEWITKVLFRKS